jgi:hypothetical protein
VAPPVIYRVEFGGGAQAQFHTLPAWGRDALIERAVELAAQPWDAVIRPPGTDAGFRETTFALGSGIIGFYSTTISARSGSSTSSGPASSQPDCKKRARAYPGQPPPIPSPRGGRRRPHTRRSG